MHVVKDQIVQHPKAVTNELNEVEDIKLTYHTLDKKTEAPKKNEAHGHQE